MDGCKNFVWMASISNQRYYLEKYRIQFCNYHIRMVFKIQDILSVINEQLILISRRVLNSDPLWRLFLQILRRAGGLEQKYKTHLPRPAPQGSWKSRNRDAPSRPLNAGTDVGRSRTPRGEPPTASFRAAAYNDHFTCPIFLRLCSRLPSPEAADAGNESTWRPRRSRPPPPPPVPEPRRRRPTDISAPSSPRRLRYRLYHAVFRTHLMSVLGIVSMSPFVVIGELVARFD
jgi:hypothetical protein